MVIKSFSIPLSQLAGEKERASSAGHAGETSQTDDFPLGAFLDAAPAADDGSVSGRRPALAIVSCIVVMP